MPLNFNTSREALFLFLTAVWLTYFMQTIQGSEVMNQRDDTVKDIGTGVPNVLSKKEKRTLQREMLSMLGLQRRPKIKGSRHQSKNSAEEYMLNLYEFLIREGDNVVMDFNNNRLLDMVSSFNYTAIEAASLQTSNIIISIPMHRISSRDLYQLNVTSVSRDYVIEAAELKIFRQVSAELNSNDDYVMSIFQINWNNDSNNLGDIKNLLGRRTLSNADHGWITFNLDGLKSQISGVPTQIVLEIAVETENGVSVDPFTFGLETVGRGSHTTANNVTPENHEPFLVMYFKTEHLPPIYHTRRFRRSVGSSRRDSNESHRGNQGEEEFECTRLDFHVSFRELEWDDWIIAPNGYMAYYCNGKCTFPLHAQLNATNHAVIQTLVSVRRPDSVPEACCTPKRLGPLQVLYYDEQLNVILKKYDDMVVRSCGCH